MSSRIVLTKTSIKLQKNYQYRRLKLKPQDLLKLKQNLAQGDILI